MTKRFHELAKLIIHAHPDFEPDMELPAEGIAALAAIIEERFGAPVLPNPGESVAVSFDSPKTAALFFDRVWHPPAMNTSLPRDLVVYGASEREIWPLAVMLAMQPPRGADWDRVIELFGESGPVADVWDRSGTPSARLYCDILAEDRGISAVPVYNSIQSCDREYAAGSSDVIIACLEGLRIIEESALTWEQVLEFRKDTTSIMKLRRLRQWLDSSLVGKSASYVQDALAIRLDDYEYALKRHGINTVMGVAADLLDPKFLAGVGAASAGLALAGVELWTAVAATGALVGRITLSIASRFVDLKDFVRTGSEVAYIHEIRQLGTKQMPPASDS